MGEMRISALEPRPVLDLQQKLKKFGYRQVRTIELAVLTRGLVFGIWLHLLMTVMPVPLARAGGLTIHLALQPFFSQTRRRSFVSDGKQNVRGRKLKDPIKLRPHPNFSESGSRLEPISNIKALWPKSSQSSPFKTQIVPTRSMISSLVQAFPISSYLHLGSNNYQ